MLIFLKIEVSPQGAGGGVQTKSRFARTLFGSVKTFQASSFVCCAAQLQRFGPRRTRTPVSGAHAFGLPVRLCCLFYPASKVWSHLSMCMGRAPRWCNRRRGIPISARVHWSPAPQLVQLPIRKFSKYVRSFCDVPQFSDWWFWCHFVFTCHWFLQQNQTNVAIGAQHV